MKSPKSEIRSTKYWYGVLQKAAGNVRAGGVRGSIGAKYVTCILDKPSGRVTLIDRETESEIMMIAGL